ncbi:MAG: DEAD/DEAH box helicase [Deltaproteobacteria bacterium]|nr:DEAD/DEAH box helicase [Deltaproteobacteria bacterium]
MYKRRKHYSQPKRHAGRVPQKLRIRPGADASLKKVFAGIGIPSSKAFQADSFQTEALEVIENSDCLVTAPTGAGKTWIAEQAIARFREKNGKSWYACPLKALSNAKYAEFSSIFGSQNVGILTGDRQENPDAPIIVGTTEILRNQLYDAMHRGKSLATDFVVLDEAHFLGDEDRGVVWEEIMIYLPVRIPLLLLSATIGNADQIADWLASIRSTPCRVVEETVRPVPLFPLFFHPSGTLLPLTVPAQQSHRQHLHKKVNQFIKARHRKNFGNLRKLPPFEDILRVLRKYDLLPAIFFLKSRADCDRALEVCRGGMKFEKQPDGRLSQKIEEYIQDTPHIANHRQRWHLEHLAMGAHHSGQLPSWKLVLEKLMTEGLLDAVFATSTVAAGVNFPARTVAFLNSDRFNGQNFSPLTPTEFHQMTGRAGRRGMDKIGFGLLIPDKFMDVRLIARLLSSPPSEVVSQIRINFSMALNLLLSHRPDQIQGLLQKSFATFLISRARPETGGPENHEHLWQDFLRHLNFLKSTGFVSAENELTADGSWASQLRVDQPLLIAEGFRRKVFPQSDPDLLAAMIAAFVNERETDDRVNKEFVPDPLTRAFSKVSKGLKPFAARMAKQRFEVRPLFMRPSAAVFAWAQGQSWESVLRIAELEEGSLAMLILRTADNLRHIRNLKDVFPQAAATAAEAIDKIMREPVAMF